MQSGLRRMQCGAVGGAALLAWVLAAGCQALGPAVPPAHELRDDIVAIQQFPPTDPWLRDEEGHVVGIKTRVYFLPATGQQEMPKGVFVPGVIKAELYTTIPRTDGTAERKEVTQWSFDQQQAAGMRINHPSIMGESYGLILRWPDPARVEGHEIQLVLSYQRLDGETVVRRGTRFRVPMPLRVPAAESIPPGRSRPSSESRPGTARPPGRS